MKNSFILRLIAFILSTILLSSLIAFDFSAAETDGSPSVSWEDKIDSLLLKKMTVETGDIPVWIWFKDIDDAIIEKEVYNRIGYKEEGLSVISTDISEDLYEGLGNYDLADDEAKEAIENEFRSYMEITEAQRNAEKKKTDRYITCLRSVHAISQTSVTSFPCAECASCRTCNTYAFQVCRDHSSCSSWCCSCAVCTPCRPL